MKRCFTCKHKYPLFFYHLDDSKYKIKANMGKTIECRLCALKRNLNNKGFTKRIEGKFTFVEANKKQIIINFFK